MSIIIEKTYQFIDELNNSQLITDLKYYKAKTLANNHALALIKEYNETTADATKLALKKSLYQIPEYKRYMELYNELSLIIFQINKKYAALTNTKTCQTSK